MFPRTVYGAHPDEETAMLIFTEDNTSPQIQNQNQNSLLVKRQNDNTSPGDWPRKISP